MPLYDDAALGGNVISLTLARDARRRRDLALMNPWMTGMCLWWAMLLSIWIAAHPKRPTV